MGGKEQGSGHAMHGESLLQRSFETPADEPRPASCMETHHCLQTSGPRPGSDASLACDPPAGAGEDGMCFVEVADRRQQCAPGCVAGHAGSLHLEKVPVGVGRDAGVGGGVRCEPLAGTGFAALRIDRPDHLRSLWALSIPLPHPSMANLPPQYAEIAAVNKPPAHNLTMSGTTRHFQSDR